MAIDPQFVMKRSGRDYVLYAGLLAEAHNNGLKEIWTDLIQKPTDDNGNTAICYAQVVGEEIDDMSPTKEKRELKFSGFGDASPKSVGKMIVPHIIRMAETRAKARALRDYCNIGMTAIEELGDESSEDSSPAPRTGPKGPEPLASKQKLDDLEVLIKEVGDMDRFEKKVGKKFSQLTSREADEWSVRLNKAKAASGS
jgi:hypothetical protein